MSDTEGVSVFLLAQNRLLREALAKVLSRRDDVAIVGSSALSSNSIREIVTASPDVLVMDIFATDLAHLEFLREIRAQVDGIRLVMIGMELHERHFLHAIQEGALGYVLKDASAAEIVAAVRAVAKGEGVCPASLCAFLFRHVARECQRPNMRLRNNLGLTNREQQLVWLISRGLTNKEIANELQLAEQTVRNHIHRMLRKLGVAHRLAIVELCKVEGLPV